MTRALAAALTLLAGIPAFAADSPQDPLAHLPALAQSTSQSACTFLAESARAIRERATRAVADVRTTADEGGDTKGDLLTKASRGPRLTAIMDEDFCAIRLQSTFAVDGDLWKLGVLDTARQAALDYTRQCARTPGEPVCQGTLGRGAAVRQALVDHLVRRDAAWEKHRQAAIDCVDRTEAQVASITPGGVPPRFVPNVRAVRAELWRLPEQLALVAQGVCEAVVAERVRHADPSAMQ